MALSNNKLRCREVPDVIKFYFDMLNAVIEFVSERDLVTFKWIKWIVMRDMPFSEVENEVTRELAGLNRCYMSGVKRFEPTYPSWFR
ncbi:hypothetical protein F441_19956 [Phytophthora nicotianae CJ01A1]|uniref:Uncharacterized protein n=3 Tax=Phytophthora nicotianae TaxID=4792 RepID=V9E3W6_PHYNI|nr:hypothetical protein F443_20080 [Phytophthora nicotianae P1569]ETP03070.1 hypothetical protein F441_19956 [Phytophthora nicotianae CJ01A1]ETP31222.1 hypothetical protein F442_19901 [Phytophthora nicotianae P10297]